METLVVIAAVLCGWAALTVLGTERAKQLHKLHQQIRREAQEKAAKERETPREVALVAKEVGSRPGRSATPQVVLGAARK